MAIPRFFSRSNRHGYHRLSEDGFDENESDRLSMLERVLQFGREHGLGGPGNYSNLAQIDIHSFIKLCKKQYHELSLPNCVFPFSDFVMLPRQYLRITSLYIRQITFMGAEQKDFDDVRDVLCSFRQVTIHGRFNGSVLMRLLRQSLETIVKLSFAAPPSNVRAQLYIVLLRLPNLQTLAVACHTPIEMEWIYVFGKLERLEIERVTDNSLLIIRPPTGNVLKELVISNCQAVESFNFLPEFHHLRTISLGQATHLQVGHLWPVFHTTLRELNLTNADHAVTDALLDELTRNGILLLRLNVPLTPGAGGVGFSMAKLRAYVTTNNYNGFVSLNVEGHGRIDNSIWEWPVSCFAAMKYLNVRHTAINEMISLRNLSKYLVQSSRSNIAAPDLGEFLSINISANEDLTVLREIVSMGVISVHCYPDDLVQWPFGFLPDFYQGIFG
jgi:hypothetical protein